METPFVYGELALSDNYMDRKKGVRSGFLIKDNYEME